MKLKYIIPLFACLIILTTGIILFLVNKDISIYSNQSFLYISLIIIGGIGGLASIFVIIYKNKLEKFSENDDKFTRLASTLKYKVEELQEQEAKQNTESSLTNQPKPIEVIRPKKIKCHYCKCKFDGNLDRCPNCGAPPEND